MSRGTGQHSSQASHKGYTPRPALPKAASGPGIIPKQLQRREARKHFWASHGEGEKSEIKKWARYRLSHRRATTVSLHLKTTPIKLLNLPSCPIIALDALVAGTSRTSCIHCNFTSISPEITTQGLLLQFSNHLWLDSQAQELCTAMQPPTGTAGCCVYTNGSSRLCSLPFGFKTHNDALQNTR